MKHIEVHVGETPAQHRIVVDGEDISETVAGVSVHLQAHELPRVDLSLIPESVLLKGLSSGTRRVES